MSRAVIFGQFEWDPAKEEANRNKHGIDFETAARAFLDPKRLIVHDETHSDQEQRFFCLGKVEKRVLTVRFVTAGDRIRIIGAGAWRKERGFYEEKNKDRSR